MKIKAVQTEKSMVDAKNGKYTFYVPVEFTKDKIKDFISKAFDVKVKSVRTQAKRASITTTLTRSKVKIKARKKAIVMISKGTIDIFETETKKKTKKTKKETKK